MKRLFFATLVLSASLAITASGQVKSVASVNNQPRDKSAQDLAANTTRVRVLGKDPKLVSTSANNSGSATSQNKRADFNNHSEAGGYRRAGVTAPVAELIEKSQANTSTGTLSARIGHSGLKPASSTVSNTASPATPTERASAPTSAAPTQIYRVGPGDVLDIRLEDNPGRNSTLFTVLDDGVLEYPLAGSAIVVGGLTTPEIAVLLQRQIKVFNNPKVKVDIRDYASHTVSISGYVAAPGTKILRREAMPLYTVLAEALVLPEAACATITRERQSPIVVDLKDAKVSATLVVPGDVIKVSGMPSLPTEFYFVGGEIGSPGQKPFHAGLTLTQAILASGDTTATAGSKVRVSRQGADGRLVTEEFNLRKINSGKTPDPILHNGDRLEVTTAN